MKRAGGRPPPAPGVRLRPAGSPDIPILRALAREIWLAHYLELLGIDQIEYMLNMMYAPEVIAAELERGVVWVLAEVLSRSGDEPRAMGEPVGFASCGREEDGTVKLHKIYVRPERHGQGIGRRLLNEALEYAREGGARRLVLRVNRGNAKAIRAYRAWGFTVEAEVKSDIGGGYVMDDFQMVLEAGGHPVKFPMKSGGLTEKESYAGKNLGL